MKAAFREPEELVGEVDPWQRATGSILERRRSADLEIENTASFWAAHGSVQVRLLGSHVEFLLQATNANVPGLDTRPEFVDFPRMTLEWTRCITIAKAALRDRKVTAKDLATFVTVDVRPVGTGLHLDMLTWWPRDKVPELAQDLVSPRPRYSEYMWTNPILHTLRMLHENRSNDELIVAIWLGSIMHKLSHKVAVPSPGFADLAHSVASCCRKRMDPHWWIGTAMNLLPDHTPGDLFSKCKTSYEQLIRIAMGEVVRVHRRWTPIQIVPVGDPVPDPYAEGRAGVSLMDLTDEQFQRVLENEQRRRKSTSNSS